MGSLRSLASMRVLIVGGNNVACPIPDLFSYLAQEGRVKEVVFIGHPFPGDFVQRSELLVGGSSVPLRWSIRRGKHQGVKSWLGDICITLWLLLTLRRRYDLYVASSLHLVLLGVLLRSIGVVENVVYWTHDYHPRRFGNSFLNGIYLKLDELSARYADYCWDVVPTIAEHRRQRGIRLSEGKVLVVGDPLLDHQINWAPIEQIPAGTIINSGAVEERGYGFDLLLEALPEVIEAQPQVKVTVTTYKEFPEELQRRTTQLGLDGHFNLLGFVPDQHDYIRVVQRHRVGLAIYEPNASSHKKYSDSRAKEYAACGVPVIMTRISPIAKEIEAANAGIVIEHDRKQLVRAIVRLLSDDDFYRQCRANAIQWAQLYRADRVFAIAFGLMAVDTAQKNKAE